MPLARKILNDTEQKTIMLTAAVRATSMAGRRAELICDVLLNSGLRATELCNLRIQDTPCHLGGKFIEIKGKGGVVRPISIPDRLTARIAEYIRTDRASSLPRHVKKDDVSRALFYNRNRKPYTRFGIYWIIAATARAAGIRRLISPHMFRHTYITNALDRGITSSQVQMMAGHSDPKIMQRYTHLLPSRIADIGNKIDRTFSL